MCSLNKPGLNTNKFLPVPCYLWEVTGSTSRSNDWLFMVLAEQSQSRKTSQHLLQSGVNGQLESSLWREEKQRFATLLTRCRSQCLSAAMFSLVPLCSHLCIPHQHKSFTCRQKLNNGDIFCDHICGGGMKLNKWLIPLCVFSCCVLLLFIDPEGSHLITIQAVNIA